MFLLWLGRAGVDGDALRCGGRRLAKIASRMRDNAGRL
jgi:hypothetical protein